MHTAVVHQKLIDFAVIKPQMIVVAPCDEALYSTAVEKHLLSEESLCFSIE